jgi:hypothetical protein
MGEQEADRRSVSRVDALVVVSLGEGRRHSVTRNVSERGLLIATRSKLEVGDRLELEMMTNSGTFSASGRVVRVDEPPGAEWRYLVGLELDAALPHDVIEDGADTAARLL